MRRFSVIPYTTNYCFSGQVFVSNSSTSFSLCSLVVSAFTAPSADFIGFSFRNSLAASAPKLATRKSSHQKGWNILIRTFTGRYSRLDSLLPMEIAYKLQKSPPISFRCPSSALALCHAVADILSLISSRPGSPAVSRKRASSTVSLLAINEEETIHRLLADTLGVKQNKLGVTDDLESHGLDSLMATEVLRALREEFNVSLPQDFFAKYRTVAQVQGQM